MKRKMDWDEEEESGMEDNSISDEERCIEQSFQCLFQKACF